MNDAILFNTQLVIILTHLKLWQYRIKFFIFRISQLSLIIRYIIDRHTNTAGLSVVWNFSAGLQQSGEC